MSKETDFHYTVVGAWPFPPDMLRYDGSKAVSAKDQSTIEWLSQVHAPDRSSMLDKVEISLVIPNAGFKRPSVDRWKTFGWTVKSEADVDAERFRLSNLEKLRDSALAKLTDEERQALEWYAGRSFTGDAAC